ncbi:acyl-CoA N-acyltransferase [Hypoxylon fragiforme]|uniref:acyl-CoA N-acyltransferase n=1 Tax=Hypoxylon fragiforme TaxID=63214 RepID=UPI0020C5C181|nr:acyl-CoA N-acyltransferase [Hypoxylon fragiforme]KAI2613564.1 acyl-CoA N-acyltransferase [Hypoxylon fragiforme]
MAAKVASASVPSDPAAPKPEFKVTISDATLSDAAAISLVGTNTFTATFGHSAPQKDIANYLASAYSPAAIEAEILNAEKNRTSIFVARDDAGAVRGFVQFARGVSDPNLPAAEAASHAEFCRLYVDTAAHGKGIGSKLIAAVEDAARAEGFKVVWLTVWENHPNAHRLYQRQGYVKVGEAEFVVGDCVQIDWVFAKNL